MSELEPLTSTVPVSKPYGVRSMSFENLQPAMESDERTSTMQTALFSLVSSIVGGGVLSLPFAFHKAGLFTAILLLILVAVASDFSSYILISCARRTGTKGYEEVAEQAFGTGARVVVVSMLFLVTFLASIGYIVLIGDLIPPVLAYALGLEYSLHMRLVTVIVCLLVIFPLCCKDNLNALTFTCILSYGATMVLAVCVGYRSISVRLAAETFVPAGLNWWPPSFNDVMLSLPVIAVAYLCHFNVLPIHAELVEPTRVRIQQVLNWTMSICTILYGWIGVVGYLYAGVDTQGNVLNNFANSDPIISIGRASLGLTCLLNFPLLVLPCRVSLKRCLALVSPAEELMLKNAESPAVPSAVWPIVQTAGLISSALVVSLYVPGVAAVWGIMGSSVSMCIAFIFPSAFYLRIRRHKPFNIRKLAAWFMLVVACCLAVLCTYQSVKAAFSAPAPASAPVAP